MYSPLLSRSTLPLPSIAPLVCWSFFHGCSLSFTVHLDHSNVAGLKSFGDIHEDRKDDEGALSVLCWAHDLPSGYHPGSFGLAEPMILFDMEGVGSFVFSGLHRHGGSPPRPKRPGTIIPKWAVRCTIIWYPSEGLGTRTAPVTLAVTQARGRGAKLTNIQTNPCLRLRLSEFGFESRVLLRRFRVSEQFTSVLVVGILRVL